MVHRLNFSCFIGPLTAALAIGACGSDSQGPAAGVVRVVVVTSGVSLDADGYTVTLDDGPAEVVLPNGQVEFTGLRSGQHRLRLEGIAPNCVPDRYLPTVTLSGNETQELTVTVTCRAPLRSGLVYWTIPFQQAGGFFHADSTGQVGSPLPGIVLPGTVTGGPKLSPGGIRVLFSLGTPTTFHMVVANLDGTGSINLSALTGKNGFSGVWSTDGSRVAFGVLGEREIVTMHPDGSGVVPLLVDGAPLAWSPDGRYLLVAWTELQGGQTVSRLDRYDLGTGAQLPLGSVNSPSEITAASYSPDGQYVAFFETTSGTSGQVNRLPAQGGGPVTLISGFKGRGYSVAWSRDGQRVAVNADTAFVPHVYVANADGSGRRNLTPWSGHGRTTSPSWTE